MLAILWLVACGGARSESTAPAAAPTVASSESPAAAVTTPLTPAAAPTSRDPVARLRELLPPQNTWGLDEPLPADLVLWDALIARLRSLPPGPERDELLRRGEAAAATWPDKVRFADFLSLAKWRAGEVPVGWSLVRAVTIYSLDDLERLLARGGLAAITALALHLDRWKDCKRWPALVAALAGAKGLDRLESLTIRLPSCAGASAVERLADLRDLPRLRRLALPGWVGPKHALALAASPLLARLEELELEGELDAAGLAALGKSPHLRDLEILRLRGHVDGPIGHVLKDTPSWTALTTLDLTRSHLDGATLAALDANPALAGLRVLELGGFGLSDDALATFAGGAGLPALEVLRLQTLGIGDRAFAALVRARGANLRELALPHGNVGRAGIAAIAGAELSRLERLDLTGNPIGAEGVRALARVRLPVLRSLKLSRCVLDGEAVAVLIAALASPHLETLDLSASLRAGGDRAAQAIAARRDWTALRALDLARAGIGPDGFVALAAAPQLAGLKTLRIDGNSPGARGWRALAGSPHLAHLANDAWRARFAVFDLTLTPADAAREIPADFELRLQRTACYGECPVYGLTVRTDGRVDYVGERHVTVTGPASGTIDLARVRLLLAAVERAFAAVRAPPPRDALCVGASDLPGAVVEIRRRGASERHDSKSLCHGAQEAIEALADRIDVLVDAGRWTGSEPR